MKLLLSLLLLALSGPALPVLRADDKPAAPPAPAAAAEAPAPFTRTEEIYGRKFGMALTLDVIQPPRPNGFGVLMMISGGWFSAHEHINPGSYAPFLDRGYTVFAVCHGSQPRFIVTEIVPDIHRAVRFVRSNAARWNIDPEHLGITGGSAGGHLSLTMGTQGGPGDANAKDPIDRASSAVQAVACFFPPTDFLNYGQTGEDAVGVGILKNFQPAFGPGSATPESRRKLGHEISPIYFITPQMPPSLIIHGDADILVPIQQARIFVEKAQAQGANAKLITKPGLGHGWVSMEADAVTFADWFDEHLRGLKKP